MPRPCWRSFPGSRTCSRNRWSSRTATCIHPRRRALRPRSAPINSRSTALPEIVSATAGGATVVRGQATLRPGVRVARRGWLGPGSRQRRDEAVAGYLAILPWLLGFLIFSAGPIVASFVLMFMRWEVLTPPAWAGLENFDRLIHDPIVPVALWNTLF